MCGEDSLESGLKASDYRSWEGGWKDSQYDRIQASQIDLQSHWESSSNCLKNCWEDSASDPNSREDQRSSSN